ncbi:MAG: hypothetical protein R3B70_05395 [Polyangiaceae bacterium]
MANAPTTQFRLGDAVPRDAVEDACAELGLRLSNVVPQTATHPAQAIYVTPDRRTLLHLLEDEAQGRAVVTRGEGAEQLTSSILRLLTARPGGQ